MRVEVDDVWGEYVGRGAHDSGHPAIVVTTQEIHPNCADIGGSHEHKFHAGHRPSEKPAVRRTQVMSQGSIVIEDRIAISKEKIRRPAQVKHSLFPSRHDLVGALHVMLDVRERGETV